MGTITVKEKYCHWNTAQIVKHSVFYALLIFLLVYAVDTFLTGRKCPFLSWLAGNLPYPDRLGNTSGIAAVITALGVVCFALSYINSARATRVKGILLEEVISSCYPCYGLIFFFHGGFALLGLYSCAEKDLHSSWICLGGLVLCAAYSVWMAYHIDFSKRGRDRLIGNYIEYLLRIIPPLKQRKGADCRSDLSSEERCQAANVKCRRAAYQLGYYIGEHYQADDLRLELSVTSGWKKGKKSILLSMLQLLMGGDWSTKEWEGALPEVFDELFSTCLDSQMAGEAVSAECTLYDLIGIDDDQTFWENVKHCAVLWDNLLAPVKRELRQAELAVNVLSHSPKTAVLCCGLVCHLYNVYIQKDSEEGWRNCVRFLQSVSNITRNVNNTDEKARSKVLRCCMDMLLVFFCLACLVEANSNESGLEAIFVDRFNNERWRNSSNVCYIPEDDQCMIRYLYYAKKIFWMLAIPEANVPDRSELCRQIPYLMAMVRQCFSQK